MGDIVLKSKIQNRKNMKIFIAALLHCLLAQNDTYGDARGTYTWSDYEASVIRAQKSIELYKEVVKKALYCKAVQSKKAKYNFRFKKAAMDVTWHVKNGCNTKRSRRSVDVLALTANDEPYFFKVGKQIKFDYEEFDDEGYGVIDEEIDQA